MSDNTNGTTEQINMESADDKQQTEETIQSSKELEITQEDVSNHKVQVKFLRCRIHFVSRTLIWVHLFFPLRTQLQFN